LQQRQQPLRAESCCSSWPCLCASGIDGKWWGSLPVSGNDGWGNVKVTAAEPRWK